MNDKKPKKDLIILFYTLFSFVLILIIFEFVIMVTPLSQLVNMRIDSESVRILIRVLIGYTAVYGGAEGTISLVKTFFAERGTFACIPEYKRKRLLGIVVHWFLLGVLVSLFSFIAQQKKLVIDFFVNDIYLSIGTSVIVYLYGRKGCKIAGNINNRKNKKLNENNFNTSESSNNDNKETKKDI